MVTDREYAMYKGDELLGVGTLKEIAEQTGVKYRSIMHYKTPSYQGRTSEKGRRLIRIDEEECQCD